MTRSVAAAVMAGLVLALVQGACTGKRTTPDSDKDAGTSVSAGKVPSPAPGAFRHPVGLEIDHLRTTLFRSKGAPDPDALGKCDFDFRAEKALARSDEEFLQTLPPHIIDDREHYHWCFYAKLLALQEDLDRMTDPGDKQELVSRRYPFLVYVARIFQVDLGDPNYLASAVYVYKKISEKHFNRKLQLTPRTRLELSNAPIPVVDPEPSPSASPAGP